MTKKSLACAQALHTSVPSCGLRARSGASLPSLGRRTFPPCPRSSASLAKAFASLRISKTGASFFQRRFDAGLQCLETKRNVEQPAVEIEGRRPTRAALPRALFVFADT